MVITLIVAGLVIAATSYLFGEKTAYKDIVNDNPSLVQPSSVLGIGSNLIPYAVVGIVGYLLLKKGRRG